MEFDFGRPFSAIFEDAAWWKRALIAGLYLLIPVLGLLVVAGWSARYGRSFMRGEADTPLPELDRFGEDTRLGFKIVVVGLVYMLAPLLLTLVGAAIAIPLTRAGQQETGGLIATIFNLLSFPVSLVLGVWTPAALALALDEDRIGSGFAIGRILALIQKNIGAYFMAVVVSIIAQLIGLVGVVGCGVGVLFTLPLAAIVHWHAVGQFWKITHASVD